MTEPSQGPYQGPYVCVWCGRLWPCPDLQRLSPPLLWPAGTTARARRDWSWVKPDAA